MAEAAGLGVEALDREVVLLKCGSVALEVEVWGHEVVLSTCGPAALSAEVVFVG